MARFTQGCLAIDPTGLDFEELFGLVELIRGKGLTEINVLIKPSPVYAYSPRLNLKDLFVIPQGSFIICNLDSAIPVGKLYLLDKDVWLDVKKVDLAVYIELVNEALAVSSSCRCVERKIDERIYRFECIDTACLEPIVLDYINLPLFWISTRRDPLDDHYQTLLGRVLKPSNGLYPFAFIRVDSSFETLTGFRKEEGLTIFIARLVKGCRLVLNYIAWFILDTLLK